MSMDDFFKKYDEGLQAFRHALAKRVTELLQKTHPGVEVHFIEAELPAYPNDPEMTQAHEEYSDAMAEYKRRSSEIYNSMPYSREMDRKMTELYDEVIAPKRKAYTDLQTLRFMGVKIIPRERKGT